MAHPLQNYPGAFGSSNPDLNQGPVATRLRVAAEFQNQLAEEKRCEEESKSPEEKRRERQEIEVQVSRHARRMQARKEIEEERGTAWDFERVKTREAHRKLMEHWRAEAKRIEDKKHGMGKMLSKLQSKDKQQSIETEANQKMSILVKDFELARNAEIERWLRELGEDRNSPNAQVHINVCIPSKNLPKPMESRCKDCQYDSILDFEKHEKEQQLLRDAYELEG